MSDELLKRGRKALALNAALACSDERDELIRDLLAEVKRFHAIVDTANATIAQFADKAEAAEARLRELASAEAVASINKHKTVCEVWTTNAADHLPDGLYQLIRRPDVKS